MRAYFLVAILSPCLPVYAAEPAKAPKAKAPTSRSTFEPGFYNPTANGMPVTVESASEPIDVTIFWNKQKAPDRSVSSENP